MSELHSIMKNLRERRKIIQRRHIKKKQKMVVDLEESIPKLRTEIEHLQIQSFNMMERLPKDNAWFVAVEYFRVFQYGFPVLDISDTRVSNLMSSSMAPYLNFGTSYGTEALTQSWKIFTQAFPDGRVQLESLKQLTTQSLIATTITSVTLTNHALKYLFQSLAEGIGDKDERKVGISTKLLNQHIVMRGSVRFDWDETSKRVIGLFTHTDMLTPMVELVGNLEDVSLVFNGALVAPDGRFNVEKATQHQ
ncbi:hypothetical protein L917_00148 [Phytophthora nicotianae]|uniref:BZIP domain-containing protein n=1 Tax=Phytophthora nicotianae TaxID=4792 RepID=W2M416_PHYNI|nr:hypothetical protein L917_00148 [Phytophthora nicotianae]